MFLLKFCENMVALAIQGMGNLSNQEQRIGQAVRRLVYSHPTVVERHAKGKRHAWADSIPRQSPEDMSNIGFMPEDDFNMPPGVEAAYYNRRAPLRQLYYASQTNLAQLQLQNTVGGAATQFMNNQAPGEFKPKPIHTRQTATNIDSRLRTSEPIGRNDARHGYSLPGIIKRESVLSIHAPAAPDNSEVDYPVPHPTPRAATVPMDNQIVTAYEHIPDHYHSAWGRRNQTSQGRFKYAHRNPSNRFNLSGQTVVPQARQKTSGAKTADRTSPSSSMISDIPSTLVGSGTTADVGSDDRTGLPLLQNYWKPGSSLVLEDPKSYQSRQASQVSSRTKLSDLNTLDVRFPTPARNPSVAVTVTKLAQSPRLGINASSMSKMSPTPSTLSRLSTNSPAL